MALLHVLEVVDTGVIAERMLEMWEGQAWAKQAISLK